MELMGEKGMVNAHLLVKHKGYEIERVGYLGKKLAVMAREEGWENIGRKSLYDGRKQKKSYTYVLPESRK